MSDIPTISVNLPSGGVEYQLRDRTVFEIIECKNIKEPQKSCYEYKEKSCLQFELKRKNNPDPEDRFIGVEQYKISQISNILKSLKEDDLKKLAGQELVVKFGTPIFDGFVLLLGEKNIEINFSETIYQTKRELANQNSQISQLSTGKSKFIFRNFKIKFRQFRV